MSILFSEMYRFVKGMADYMKAVIALPAEKKEEVSFLKLIIPDEETIIVADTLKEFVPITRTNIAYMSKSYQKIRLVLLVERMEKLRNQLSSDTNLSISVSSKELEAIEVWSFECTNNNILSAKPSTYSYLGLIFDELSRVSLLPKIQLLACTLSADNEKVYINLEWDGPFENIEFLTIPGVARRFWKVTCGLEESALSFNVMRYLLNLQIVVAWGDNELSPGAIQDNKLTADIILLRRDLPKPTLEMPLSEISWQNVSDYVIQQFYPNYLKTSQKLELKLSDELERRKKYVQQGLLESKYEDQIHEWREGLIKLRKAYLEEISKVK